MADIQQQNDELKDALRKIRYHIDQINEIYNSISEIIKDDNEQQVSENDVKKLLQKYSRL